MTAVTAAVITAIVGELGTPSARLVSHHLTTRQRAEEREQAGHIRLFAQRRAAYTAINRASRQFSALLKDAPHRLRDGVYTDQERTALEEAHLDYRDRYAEAQMIVPPGLWRLPEPSTASWTRPTAS
ncbi:hypothetical protein [Streptomyces sp. AJS327]|uniref:hypothetical protein n=1 Tax=Streptomyces sp. AJS327 TaxID=2545265 RepID=UPI002155BB7D|nr:hypothetical protein [Streptomyces sp. AJS327]